MKRTVETHELLTDFRLDSMASRKPSITLAGVRIHKYRVTVEKIEESLEVLRDRILEVIRDCRNIHYKPLLIREAEKYGIDAHTVNREFGRGKI